MEPGPGARGKGGLGPSFMTTARDRAYFLWKEIKTGSCNEQNVSRIYVAIPYGVALFFKLLTCARSRAWCAVACECLKRAIATPD